MHRGPLSFGPAREDVNKAPEDLRGQLARFEELPVHVPRALLPERPEVELGGLPGNTKVNFHNGNV